MNHKKNLGPRAAAQALYTTHRTQIALCRSRRRAFAISQLRGAGTTTTTNHVHNEDRDHRQRDVEASEEAPMLRLVAMAQELPHLVVLMK